MAKLIRTSLVTFALPLLFNHWMQYGVRLGGKCKLLHHVTARQVVAATSIDDHMARTLFDDTLCLKQCMPLILLCLLHLRAQHMLHNEALIAVGYTCINIFFWTLLTTCMVSRKKCECIFIKFTSRGVLTIIFYNQNTFSWAVTHDMPKPLAPVTLNVPCSTRWCHRWSSCSRFQGSLACWICGAVTRLFAGEGGCWTARWRIWCSNTSSRCSGQAGLHRKILPCRNISLDASMSSLHLPFSFLSKMEQTGYVSVLFISKDVLNFPV